MSFIYLATPYSKYKDGQEVANKLASFYAGEIIKEGLPVFCPISHSHAISVNSDLAAKDHSIWMPLDFAFTEAAFAMVVCMMSGWDDSYGIKKEIEYFKAHNKPIYYWEPIYRSIGGAEGFLLPIPTKLLNELKRDFECHKEKVTNKFVPDLHY